MCNKYDYKAWNGKFSYYQKFCLILHVKEQNFCTLYFSYHLEWDTATSVWDICHSRLTARVHGWTLLLFLVTLSFCRIEHLKPAQPYALFDQMKIVIFCVRFCFGRASLRDIREAETTEVTVCDHLYVAVTGNTYIVNYWWRFIPLCCLRVSLPHMVLLEESKSLVLLLVMVGSPLQNPVVVWEIQTAGVMVQVFPPSEIYSHCEFNLILLYILGFFCVT